MSRSIALLPLAACVLVPSLALAQSAATREEQTVQTAAAVLNEIMSAERTRIPQSMLADAQGVAIVPGVIKGGFVVGVRHGRGVVVVRDEQGGWQPPQFVSLTGGSLGWQAGVQSTDVVLVFKTQKSVQNLMRGKFTVGVDAAAAAGPVGREAAAATDARLQAEIYSYSRSRGLFAGVSLDGSALQIEQEANSVYYRAPANMPGAPQIPASAVKLMNALAMYTSGAQPADVDGAPATVPVKPHPSISGPAGLKPQLADSARQLSQLVDESWQRFLALPAEVYSATDSPSAESLAATVARYDRIAQDARYRALAERAEFRATHDLLRRYKQSLSAQPAGLPSLPPPPLDQ